MIVSSKSKDVPIVVAINKKKNGDYSVTVRLKISSFFIRTLYEANYTNETDAKVDYDYKGRLYLGEK